MKFVNTRNASEVSCCDAIAVKNDGGLYVPSSLPILKGDDLDALVQMSCDERVAKILSMFLDEFSYEELFKIVSTARQYRDDNAIVKVEDGLYMLEMWYGASYTCKDVTLEILPHLIQSARTKLGLSNKLLGVSVIGRDLAEIKMFEDVPNCASLGLCPNKNISETVHKLALQEECDNVRIATIKGDRSQIRGALKKVLDDSDLKSALDNSGVSLLSDETPNIARVLVLIGEFISAYCDLVDCEEIEIGQKVNFALPCANLTSALACYYASKMGLPINKVVLAANANNAIVKFFTDGEFEAKSELYRTISGGLDKIDSVNLERFIFECVNHDFEKTCECLHSFKTDGKFCLDNIDALSIFESGWADEEDTKQAIFTFFDLDDYLMCPNTAVVASVYNDYSCETDDETPTIITSLENPYLSAVDVLGAIGSRERDEHRAIGKLENLTALECPEEISVEVECHDEKAVSVESIKALILMQLDKLN